MLTNTCCIVNNVMTQNKLMKDEDGKKLNPTLYCEPAISVQNNNSTYDLVYFYNSVYLKTIAFFAFLSQ